MIDLLKETNATVYLTAAGAGTTWVKGMWLTLGVSQVLAGASLPYHQSALEQCLGHKQEGSAVTEDVAYDLAIHAFIQAAAADTRNPVGIGVTAAIAKDRVPRGELHAHIVVIAMAGVAHNEVMLERGSGEELRQAHDATIDWAITSLVSHVLRGGALNDTQQLERAKERILAYPVFTETERRTADSVRYGVFLPATLNPLHHAHSELMLWSEIETKREGCYLVETEPPHKAGPTAPEMLLKVAAARADRHAIWFTSGETLFVEKARRHPRSTFAIGADTMARMLQPDWGPEPFEMLKEFDQLGVSFIVMDRQFPDGKVYSAKDIQVPPMYRKLFRPLNIDPIHISSTEIRKGA